ncbi:MAG TPA: riboflavin synthase [bacterium]|nr:riboflavin synthase [bacterium]
MFTGIIERKGLIKRIEHNSITVDVGNDFNVGLGDSVSVNGVCLTARSIKESLVSFDISKETLSVSNLKGMKIGQLVNLERAMLANGRFGGHFVSGHADSVGTILNIKDNSDSIDIHVKYDTEYSSLIVDKGSIALNGVSLTVNEVKGNTIRLTVIPYTLKVTNIIDLKVGDEVNIEFDVLAKYVQRTLDKDGKNKITEEYLKGLGYE